MTDPQEWYGEEAATLGDRLAAARMAAGLSQAQLAARLGVRPATLRNWEDDRSEPRANRLQVLAGLLNVSLGWLLTGRGEGPAPADEGPDAPSVEEAALLDELRAIRAEHGRLGDRLAHLEKRLRKLATARG